MDAVISGEAGLAFLFDENGFYVCRSHQPDTLVPVPKSVFPGCFAGSRDLVYLEELDCKVIGAELVLQHERSKVQRHALYILDGTLSDETRRAAAIWLQDHRDHLPYLRQALAVAPVPADVDQRSCLALCHGLVRVRRYLSDVFHYQPSISRLHTALAAAPNDVFVPEHGGDREAYVTHLVRHGKLWDLVVWDHLGCFEAIAKLRIAAPGVHEETLGKHLAEALKTMPRDGERTRQVQPVESKRLPASWLSDPALPLMGNLTLPMLTRTAPLPITPINLIDELPFQFGRTRAIQIRPQTSGTGKGHLHYKNFSIEQGQSFSGICLAIPDMEVEESGWDVEGSVQNIDRLFPPTQTRFDCGQFWPALGLVDEDSLNSLDPGISGSAMEVTFALLLTAVWQPETASFQMVPKAVGYPGAKPSIWDWRNLGTRPAQIQGLDASSNEMTNNPFLSIPSSRGPAWGLGNLGQWTERVQDHLAEVAHKSLVQASPGQVLKSQGALCNVCLILMEGPRPNVMQMVSQTLYRFLVDLARHQGFRKEAIKLATPPLEQQSLNWNWQPETVLAIHSVLETLENEKPEFAEIVKSKMFAGFSLAEIAKNLMLSTTIVRRKYHFVRMLIQKALEDSNNLP